MSRVAARDASFRSRVAFDRLAHEYDSIAAGEVFRRLRARTHRAFTRSLAPGSRLLEIGCGTGLDTAFLAGLGCQVVACDPSEEMVSRAMCRLARQGLGDRATVMPCGLHELPTYLDALAQTGPFDGVVSNFGALNCVADLAPLGRLAERYLRPHGQMILVLMSRVCAVEAAYFTVTGRKQLVARRRRDGAVSVPVAGVDVPTFFHRTAEVCRALGPGMRLVALEGIGVAIPPPYLEPRWLQLPPGVRRLISGVDGVLARWPGFNRIGDHILLRFRKRGHAHA